MAKVQLDNGAGNDNFNDSEDSSPSDDSSNNELDQTMAINVCLKVNLPEHIAAYIEKRELIRDTAPIKCDSGVIENVMTNYIIAKKILSNLCWQEKLLCKHVCTTWRSAVNSLMREKMSSVDFVYDLQKYLRGIKFKKSDDFCTEPLAVFSFANAMGCNLAGECRGLMPCPCKPSCEDISHSLIDVLNQQVCAPKNCMLTVVATYLAYMPLPREITFQHTIPRFDMITRLNPFICGVYIPAIPGVRFHMLNIRQKNRNTIDMQSDFFDVIDKLAQDRIFKGVLVYVTDKYILQTEEVLFLNYLKEVQPTIPYALGGCIVEETLFDQNDINLLVTALDSNSDFVSENLISIGLFTVPKEDAEAEQGDKHNFDVYSLVIEAHEWAKPKIQQTINEFAKKVPQFQHSVALKLSCVGRDQKHAHEQDYFRAAFPRTPLIGCYGNGELGINHPPRPAHVPVPRTTVKRRRSSSGSQGIMYSYSTVFMYIGWGKMTSTPEAGKA